MDLLKAEIERKKASASAVAPNKRYLTASERREIEEQRAREEEAKARERQREKKRRKRQRGDDQDDDEGGENLVQLLTKKYDRKEKKGSGRNANSSNDGEGILRRTDSQSSEGGSGVGGKDLSEAMKQLPPHEVAAALRRFNMPIRLFGESTSDVLNRLLIAMQGREAAMIGEGEKDEFLLDSAHRTRNVFLEKERDNDDDNNHKNAAAGIRSSKQDAKTNNDKPSSPKPHTPSETQPINDPPKQIYRYLKSLLRQWENDLSLRTDAVKRTAAGKNETKTLKQCKDYIRPLFQMCKRRELETNMQNHLLKIVTYCEQGEFVKAHDAYLDVAIGRAAWPIGVTMVGIHARSGREKIGSANVAHVMNSELHRKYLTSVKRLMSYDQRKRVDVDPSKKVMNL
ncbi:hypothetical protein ACHAWX_003973 [Stephanocyclus meneghinianus]